MTKIEHPYEYTHNDYKLEIRVSVHTFQVVFQIGFLHRRLHHQKRHMRHVGGKVPLSLFQYHLRHLDHHQLSQVILYLL